MCLYSITVILINKTKFEIMDININLKIEMKKELSNSIYVADKTLNIHKFLIRHNLTIKNIYKAFNKPFFTDKYLKK